METHLLEINLISAQNLKPPSSNLRHMETYATIYTQTSSKLRTRIDRLGNQNPTWNDKFIFRVTTDFLSSETSAISIEIYTVAFFKDRLIGTVRFLINNCYRIDSDSGSATPSPSLFTALQIRRLDGSFHGILNLGVMVINGSDFTTKLNCGSAIDHRDMMGKVHQRGKSEVIDLEQDEKEYSSGAGGAGGDSDCKKISNYRKNSKSNGQYWFCGLGFKQNMDLRPLDQNMENH